MKRREVKSKEEQERYTYSNSEFQRIARKDKKAFLSDQCKNTEKVGPDSNLSCPHSRSRDQQSVGGHGREVRWAVSPREGKDPDSSDKKKHSLLLSFHCSVDVFFFFIPCFMLPSDIAVHFIGTVQFSSVAQSCLTLCDPVNRSTPGLPVHQQLPEFTQTHVHQVSDAIQLSHPLSSPSPPAPNPSQHQSLFQ